MIPREQMHLLQEMVKYYPVVSLTGPRQSGKSTLVRAAFPNYEYVNLENPQIRTEAEEDPVGFIHNRPNQLIIDEAQHVPELFSMIQTVVDEHDHPGQYILSGSQNFLMTKHISQTLAGRIGLLKLLPLSYQEVCEAPGAARRTNLNDFMLSGGYPRIYTNFESGIKPIPLDIFYSNYLSTYVERDVAGFLDVRNILGFRKFV